jgi:extradiol dioxygenase family protein
MSTTTSPAGEQQPPIPPFHLAFPCLDVEETVAFYEGLGCTVGRHSEHAAILGFFGHQIVAHRTQAIEPQHGIYPRHFGVMVDVATLDRLEVDLRRLAADRTKRAHRFPGEWIEHHSLQSRDPSGNVLEFKAYTNPEAVFGDEGDARIGDLPS